MKSEYEVFVLTGDRDLGDTRSMEGIKTNQWIDYSAGVKVFYAPVHLLSLSNIAQHIQSIQPNVIYLNSMFSKKFTIYPLWLKRSNRISSKIVLAPRGMLKSTALDFKKRKKKIFLSVLKWLKIPQLVTFHATDEREREEIIKQFGTNTRVETISNFPGSQDELVLPQEKSAGSLDILYVGRIHPIKGLHVLLEAVSRSAQNIRVTIVGNAEDINYRDQCKRMIREFPSNVQATFTNEVPHHTIGGLIKQHHIFCLPTRGENFGHAIFESLSAGRPVLISDQTPWRNLEKYKAGWDLPLADPGKFAGVIEKCALMNADEFKELCHGAWQFCNKYLQASNTRQQYLKLFS